MKRDKWPVTPESGPAPNGRPDECFYCKVPVGGEHAADCVMRQRTVVCRVSFEYVRVVPEVCDAKMIEFNMNGSSSCSNNLITEIVDLHDRLEARGECLCGFVKGIYVREADKGDEEKNRLSIDPAPVDGFLEGMDVGKDTATCGTIIPAEPSPSDLLKFIDAANRVGVGVMVGDDLWWYGDKVKVESHTPQTEPNVEVGRKVLVDEKVFLRLQDDWDQSKGESEARPPDGRTVWFSDQRGRPVSPEGVVEHEVGGKLAILLPGVPDDRPYRVLLGRDQVEFI